MHRVPRSTPPQTAWLLPAGTLFFMCGILLGRSAFSWHGAAFALLLCAVAALLSHGWRRFWALLLGMAALGAGLGWQAYHPQLPFEGEHLVQGTVVQELHLRPDGQVQTILSSVTLDGSPAADAYWTYYLPEDETPPDWLIPGAQVILTARVYHPEGLINPGGFNFKEYLLQRGVHYGLYGSTALELADGGFSLRGSIARIRHDLTVELSAVMGEEAGAYAAAMLLGTRDHIPEDDRAAFRELGIAHVLSISGFHVGVLVGLLLLILRPLSLARTWRVTLEAALLGLYCLLTGGNAPVIRASLLLLWRELTHLRHRQVLPLHLLCVTALVQLLFDPIQLTGPSFQLTYGAMLGLLLVYPQLRRLRAFSSRRVQRLWEALCASAAAQLGVLLPQLYWFGQLPVLSVLLNIPVIAVAAWLITLYWATLLTLPIPGLRTLMGGMCTVATDLLLRLVRALAEFPMSLWLRQPDGLTFAGWALLIAGASGLLPRQMTRHRGKMLLLGGMLMALLLLPLPENTTEYTMFAVGNEDAALLQDQDMTVVIDTGEDGQALASYLHQRRRSVDALIITHLHTDHASGIQALLDEGIPVDVCYLPTQADVPVIDVETLPIIEALRQTGTEFRHLHRGDVIDLPSGQLTVLWPEAGRVSPLHDANDVNLVLQADIAGMTMLLTGDLTGTYEHYAALPSDILHVAHHGSKDATSADFLATVQPQILLLSNRAATREERMQILAGDIPLYSTDTHGAVTVRFLGDGKFTVEPMK